MQTHAGRIVGDDGPRSTGPEGVPDGVAVIGGVCQADRRCHRADEVEGHRGVAAMAGSDDQSPGTALFVDRDVELGRAPAAGASDGLGLGPPFPPAADRCAFT